MDAATQTRRQTMTSRTPRFTRFRQEIATAFRHLFQRGPVRETSARPRHVPTVIVAYNFPQAREHAQRKGFHADWRYAANADHLRGYHHCNLVLLEGWERNKDGDFQRAVEQLQRFNEAGRQA
jgi:hypothetical protein